MPATEAIMRALAIRLVKMNSGLRLLHDIDMESAKETWIPIPNRFPMILDMGLAKRLPTRVYGIRSSCYEPQTSLERRFLLDALTGHYHYCLVSRTKNWHVEMKSIKRSTRKVFCRRSKTGNKSRPAEILDWNWMNLLSWV